MEETKEVRVIILGSGTGLPSSFRGSASIVFHYQGRWFLFDIGPGTLRQLTRIGIDHSRIEAIWVTHFHPDHTADLIHLIFATKHPKVLEHRKAFKLFGPRGVKQFVSDLQKAYGSYLACPKGSCISKNYTPLPNAPLYGKNSASGSPLPNILWKVWHIEWKLKPGQALFTQGIATFVKS